MPYKIAFLVLLFAVPVFCQGEKTTVPGDPELTENWSRIGNPIEGPRGFTLEGRGIRMNASGAYELWVKILPANTAVFTKRYALPKSTEYVLQFATVDCSKNLLLLEKTSAYNSGNKVLEGNMSVITPSSKRDVVRPGSIGEALFRFVCEDPSKLIKTN